MTDDNLPPLPQAKHFYYSPDDTRSVRKPLDLFTTEQMIAYGEECKAHAVPPGHQVVPDEPTQEMCQEGQWKAQEWPKFPLRIVPIYKAMINAAPGHLLVNPGARNEL